MTLEEIEKEFDEKIPLSKFGEFARLNFKSAI